MKKIFVLFIISNIFFAVSCFAATDGQIGTTSTGSSDISLDVPKLIVARGFTDFNFSSYTGYGDMEISDEISVATNINADYVTYRVTANGNCAGNSPSNAFNISDGTNLLEYRLTYHTGLFPRTLSPGSASPTHENPNYPLSETSNNATITISFYQTPLQSVPAGNYTGTVTFTFEPE